MRREELEKRTTEALGKREGDSNNAAVVNMRGVEFSGGGVRDVEKEGGPDNEVNSETMFAEGSIGKVRYAGLAYILAQEGIFGEQGLQKNAKDFFAQEKVGQFLESKYPGTNLQSAIVKLFTDGSEVAALADLTTHRSGIGDTTTDALEMIKSRGYDYQFTLPDLVLPQEESTVPRNPETGKPMAKKGLEGKLAPAVYGDHEYSNLGYQILACAMEAAYFIAKGREKDYQQLTEDFLFHPIEGRAKDSGLSFDRTKFPKDLVGDDNAVQAKLVKGGEVLNVNQLSAANAAGGIFSSAGDSSEFFSQYFKGFPGTEGCGQDGINPFFTKDTIEQMEQQAYKHEKPANQPAIEQQMEALRQWEERNAYGEEVEDNKKPVIPNPQLQFPGAVATVDDNGEVVNYAKTGGTAGFISRLEFLAKTGEVDISMINQENVTSYKEKAKEAAPATATESQSWVDRMDLKKARPNSFVGRLDEEGEGRGNDGRQ